MKKFKKGQVVYVKNHNDNDWDLRHYATYVQGDKHPYRTHLIYQKAMRGEESLGWDECMSIEEYQKMMDKPKDKDLVWAWDNATPHRRKVMFYDAENHCCFHQGFALSSWKRDGEFFDNYEVIDDWLGNPNFAWVIDLFHQLEN